MRHLYPSEMIHQEICDFESSSSDRCVRHFSKIFPAGGPDVKGLELKELVPEQGVCVPSPALYAKMSYSRREELVERLMRAQRFKGKVAVVTGGNSGIGLGVAKAYAQEGAQVAITGRNKNTLEAAAKEIGDGTLAIQSDAGNLAEIEAAMKKINERHLGMPGTTVYGATKAAVVNMAKTLSADLLEKGIRVNVISPGPITSALLTRDGITQEKLQETKDWIQSKVPIKRFGTPEEIAAAVLYLTSPESAFVVGTELVIDGGMSRL